MKSLNETMNEREEVRLNCICLAGSLAMHYANVGYFYGKVDGSLIVGIIRTSTQWPLKYLLHDSTLLMQAEPWPKIVFLRPFPAETLSNLLRAT